MFSGHGMDLRGRGIFAVARTLNLGKKWLTTDFPAIQRGFSSYNENSCLNTSYKAGFEAFGARWTIEPLSDLSSGGLGTVRVTCGTTVVLARIQKVDGGSKMSSTYLWRRSRDPSMQVEYKEHYHAVGKFPPVFDRRETLITARERRISNEIQDVTESIIVPESDTMKDICIKLSVLSSHKDYDSEIVAMNAASAALASSPGIPWYGPVGAIRIYFVKDQNGEVKCLPGLSALPVNEECENDTLGSMLVVCGNDGILRSSGDANDLHPKYIKTGLQIAQNVVRDSLLEYQMEFAKRKGEIWNASRQPLVRGADPAAARRMLDYLDTLVAKYFEFNSKSCSGLEDYVQSTLVPSIKDFCSNQGRWRSSASRIKGSGCATIEDVAFVTASSVESCVRGFWDTGMRPDGRAFDDILPDSIEVNYLPTCHGSSMYSGGDTNIITAVTCGSLSEGSNIEHTVFGSLPHRVSAACISHQNKGRGRINSDDLNVSDYLSSCFSRLIPSMDDLPFSFRISTTLITMESCMISSCLNGAAVAMQNLGVRLRHPVGAATVGLACKYPEGSLDGEEKYIYVNELGVCGKQQVDDYSLIVDPNGLESTFLDATLVSSGSGSKITCWVYTCHKPVDVTLHMLHDMIDVALKSQKSRLKSLSNVVKGKSHHKAKFGRLSVHPATLPKLQSDKGAILNEIENQTGGKVHVGEDGLINLFAPSSSQYESLEDAVVQAAGANLVPGRIYKARVTTIKDFGAFVELPGSDIEALLHISEISSRRIASVEDELSLKQELDVLFQGRDKMGNLRVSLKGAADKNRNLNKLINN